MDLMLSRSKATSPGSAHERIRLAIEEEILTGKRPPGSAIDEKAVALAFSASRTPVREALLTLAAQGLVHIAPRAGIYVRQASSSELIATLEALSELESLVARLAARRATQIQRTQLKKALQETTKRSTANDRHGYEVANAALHSVIYAASSNPVLVEHVRSVRKTLAAYRQRGFDKPGRLQVSNREHALIVKAICDGDEQCAADAMRQHINVGADALVAILGSADNMVNTTATSPPRRNGSNAGSTQK